MCLMMNTAEWKSIVCRHSFAQDPSGMVILLLFRWKRRYLYNQKYCNCFKNRYKCHRIRDKKNNTFNWENCKLSEMNWIAVMNWNNNHFVNAIPWRRKTIRTLKCVLLSINITKQYKTAKSKHEQNVIVETFWKRDIILSAETHARSRAHTKIKSMEKIRPELYQLPDRQKQFMQNHRNEKK